ncbi:MAG: hypothetical protein JWR01_2225, partial [Subtercola sp.]|nr:hypothetical protein [Subtercola sp.]
MDIEDALRTLGGVAHHSELLPLGITLDGAARAVRSGRIERIRRGWFRVADAPTDVVSAVRVGGALTCVSVLKTLGVWCVDDEILHVRLGRGISHAGSPTDRTVPLGDPTLHGVHVHRSLASTLRPAGRVAVDTVDDALMQIVVCQPRDHAIAAFDSALNLKLTTRQR